jgi:dihydroorotate dehydrogenase electron transfer subunit
MNGHRDSIPLIQARVVEQQSHPGEQWLMRLHAPACAERATPGSFVHLTVDPQRPMRRPLSIMRAAPEQGWIDILYKVVGEGTRLLSERRDGDEISLLGPIGNGFQLHPQRTRPLLLGGGVGMPPMLFLADQLRRQKNYQPLVLLASEVPFPFQPMPSQIMIPELPGEVIAAMPLLEDWRIPSRLASQQGYAGCYQGWITDLARHWLGALDADILAQVELFACGPTPMLQACAALARDYSLPCQLSLEEYMACAVGGCAGCVVPVRIDGETQMKRVCVDGPVFPAEQVF